MGVRVRVRGRVRGRVRSRVGVRVVLTMQRLRRFHGEAATNVYNMCTDQKGAEPVLICDRDSLSATTGRVRVGYLKETGLSPS